MKWYTAGTLTNPTAATVLATTGLILHRAGTSYTITVSANIGAAFTIEERDSVPTVIGSQFINWPVTLSPFVQTFKFTYDQTVELRVVLHANITGIAQASIVRNT